jgi:hypothetical protein
MPFVAVDIAVLDSCDSHATQGLSGATARSPTECHRVSRLKAGDPISQSSSGDARSTPLGRANSCGCVAARSGSFQARRRSPSTSGCGTCRRSGVRDRSWCERERRHVPRCAPGSRMAKKEPSPKTSITPSNFPSGSFGISSSSSGVLPSNRRLVGALGKQVQEERCFSFMGARVDRPLLRHIVVTGAKGIGKGRCPVCMLRCFSSPEPRSPSGSWSACSRSASTSCRFAAD